MLVRGSSVELLSEAGAVTMPSSPRFFSSGRWCPRLQFWRGEGRRGEERRGEERRGRGEKDERKREMEKGNREKKEIKGEEEGAERGGRKG